MFQYMQSIGAAVGQPPPPELFQPIQPAVNTPVSCLLFIMFVKSIYPLLHDTFIYNLCLTHATYLTLCRINRRRQTIHLLGYKEDRGGTHGVGRGRWSVIHDVGRME